MCFKSTQNLYKILKNKASVKVSKKAPQSIFIISEGKHSWCQTSELSVASEFILTIFEREGFCCGYKLRSIPVACSKLQIVAQFYSLTLQYDIDKC